MGKSISMKFIFLLVVISVLLAVSGCGSTKQPDGTQGNVTANDKASSEKANWPKVLRLGILPGEGAQGESNRQSRKYGEDLSKELGIPVEVFEGEDYSMVIEAMRAKKVDLATLGSFEYIIAVERSGVLPIGVGAKSQETAYYGSRIIVPANSTAQKVQDLKGKNFMFVDPASTSGHLFPRALLLDRLGLKNDQLEGFFGSLTFSGGHDKSVLAIKNGNADGAAVADVIIDRMVKGGLMKETDVRIIDKVDKIPNGPLSYRKDLPESLVQKIKDFTLNYHNVNPDYFAKQGYTAYYPVTDTDFDTVRKTAKDLNLSPETLLKKK